MTPRTFFTSRARRRVLAVLAALVVAAAGTACDGDPKPWSAFGPIGELDSPTPVRYYEPVFSDVDVTSNITWSTAPDLDDDPMAMKLDVYEPRGDTVTHRPAVVVAHSGGFFIGSKTNSVSVDLARHFAKAGYVVISIDYRRLANVDCGSLQGLISDASGCKVAAMAATSDGQAAVRWLRANADTYGVDAERIAMIGDSAGAIMAILAGMLADVPGNPEDPASIEAMAGAPLNTSNLDQSSEVQAWSSISGGLPPTETPGLAEKLAESETLPSPGYLFSGTKDNQTPFAWSEATRDELVKLGRFVFWGPLEGAGHVPYSAYGTLFKTQSTRLFYLAMGSDAATS
ncbi:MAG TPA: alpha/beta hydrolase [Acidimicrobiales bacterium]|nr:alpha/beta hydrolase [Acidimicrobiales bacterium]